MIILGQGMAAPGVGVRGAGLVIQNWRATGVAEMVAPLHVHHADDEAWHVISGAPAERAAVYRRYESELLELPPG